MGHIHLGPKHKISEMKQMVHSPIIKDNSNLLLQNKILDLESKLNAQQTKVIEKPIYVDRFIEVPIIQEKIVEVNKEIPVEKIVRVIQEKIVEKPIFLDKFIEVPVLKEVIINKSFIPLWLKAIIVIETLMVALLLLK